MKYCMCSDAERIRRTELETTRRVKMILDTDTYNEIDDQFAILYALCSKEKIELLGITAALFDNKRSESAKDGMEKSYQEIKKTLKLAEIESDNIAFRGCVAPLKNVEDYENSEAVDFMISCAMQCTKDEPLYIVGIGAATNIASAIMKKPEIMERIVVVWLGGNTYEWSHNIEFNLSQDIFASRVLFDSGVPLIQVPALGVTGFLLTSIPELQTCLGGVNEIGDYLVENVMKYEENHFAWSKPIWDIGAISLFVNPDWAPQKICPAPMIVDKDKYAFDQRRHLIRCVYELDRDKIFKDMFQKIRAMK